VCAIGAVHTDAYQRDGSLSNGEKLIGLCLTRFTLDNAVPSVSS